jgi:transcriptional regulator with XRE-family HTH domain
MNLPAANPSTVPDEETQRIELGQRIRWTRNQRGLSMRALAGSVGVSQSALSQIETGRSQPSVQTLYRLVRELGVSFDELMGLDTGDRADEVCLGGMLGEAPVDFLPTSSQKRIDLDTGVTWHRLTSGAVAGANFFRILHPAGSGSAPAGKYVSHAGHEFVYVLSGTLRLEVGFDTEHLLHAGDAMNFPAPTPHRASNPGPDPTEILCAVIGGTAAPLDK